MRNALLASVLAGLATGLGGLIICVVRQRPEAKSPSLGLMLGFLCVTVLSQVV